MKAIVLAAGEGKRMMPFTSTIAKCMIPVANVPLLKWLLISLRDSGIQEVCIVIGYKGEQIKQYFKSGEDIDLHLKYVVQEKQRGTADALKSAKSYIGEKEFLLVYGDIFVEPKVIKRMISSKDEAEISVGAVKVEHPEEFGTLILEGTKVIDIIEKPENPVSNVVNAGIYKFSSKIFEAIEKTKPSSRNELELTDSIKYLIEQGVDVRALNISNEEWLDVGRPWDLLEANKRALEKQKPNIKGKVEEGAHISGSVVIEEGSVVKSGAYIEGPVIIGKNCSIGPNCYIRPHTSIGSNVRIGNACEVKNSIIMNNVRIAHLSYVADSIIGPNCNIGAGTITANLRLDEKTVKVLIEGKVVDSRLRKLGTFMGENVKVGVGSLIMPGVKIGNNSMIGPGSIIYRDVPENCFYQGRVSSQGKGRYRELHIEGELII